MIRPAVYLHDSPHSRHILPADLSSCSCLSPATVVLTGLEPNTTYEVRVAAVNGKGQGEFSHTETFQTLPIRKRASVLRPPSHVKTFFKIRASQLIRI